MMKKKILFILGIIALAILALGIYWIHFLKVAHSSFENYYNFRGCTELLEKTDTYGTCKLSSGQTIKIVKYEDKWFLDGDLPRHATQNSGAETGYKNTTYIIEGQSVALLNGRAKTSIVPGAASKTRTDYFGNEATGDLSGDGLPDTAFIVTQNSGGSATFYYVVVALKTKTGYQGTNAILLGDRIAPQTTEIKDGELIVNYADRKQSDPMVVAPSVSMSKYIMVKEGSLVEVLPVTK